MYDSHGTMTLGNDKVKIPDCSNMYTI